MSRQTVWRAGRAPLPQPRGEPTGFDALDALLPQSGWPCAALTELLLPCDGVGEITLLLPTLARLTQAGGIVVLVAPPYVPYAPAWQEAGVDLSRLHIVDADARGALWAFEQCLRSGACAAVLGWPRQGDAQALRRLQVAAGSGDCLGFAFRDCRHAANPSPAALRIEYARDGEGHGAWHVRKCRGGNAPARPFVMEDPGQHAQETRSLVTQEHEIADAQASVVPFPFVPTCGDEGLGQSSGARGITSASEAESTPVLLQKTDTYGVIASPTLAAGVL